ncbi:MAG: histidine kinase [Bacteroidia bacterium]|jgi:sensor histidine kinase YesM|nr:histidine kinase [Bacteroidia bacterium]
MTTQENTKQESIKDLRERIIGIPLVGVLGMLMSRGGSMVSYLESLLLSLFFTFSLWHLMRYLVIRLRTKFPGLSNTRKRILYQLGIGIPVTILFMSGFCVNYGLFKYGSQLPMKPIIINTIVGLVITLFISTIYECAYFFKQWKQSLLEAQELKRQNIISQFETLKSQVNPHFLFNSLNTLTVLIEENQTQAVHFVQQLSQVYRYVLQAREKNTVALAEELDFIRAYLYLLQIRFGDHLKTEIETDAQTAQLHIPPLALQLLVENAIKHNVISAAQPLRLSISTNSSGELTVKNVLQKKNTPETPGGFGLSSIMQRYHLLGAKPVRIMQEEGFFSVVLPLLQPEQR